MDRNQILLTLVNDISGEHGVQIGHAGHAYGTTLPADQKRALVEYLKTL